MLTLGELYAGIGGFGLGFERAGMRTLWQVEKDSYCRRVLAKHFPNAHRFNDVREVTGSIQRWEQHGGTLLEYVDVLAAGVPCQPTSGAGLGLGDQDERWMWPDTLRLIGELRPRYAVMENPAIFLGRGADGVLGELSVLGYDAEWEVVSACAFGAPHTRRRVFIVAYPQGERCDGWRGAFPSAQPMEPAGRDTGSGRTWAEEPRPIGVADGVPARMDRLGALGNSLVPQIAEWLGRRIIEAEGGIAA